MNAELTAKISAYELSADLEGALRSHGLAAEAQAMFGIASDDPFETEVRLGSATVAVRWFLGQGPEEEERAYTDARSLLKGKSAIECAIAVCYPPGITPDSLNAAHYKWQVIQPRDGVHSGWTSGNLSHLVFFIRLSLAGPRALDAGAQALVDALESRPDGVVAAVLRLVSATNEDDRSIRQSLRDNYRIAYIISSHDPRRDYFSGRGRQTEVLIVCHAWGRDSRAESPTRVVNLARNPSTPREASAVARVILDGNPDELGHGAMFDLDPAEVASGDWGTVHFLSPLLTQRYSDLVRGRMFRVVTLDEVASVGTTGTTIRKGFVAAIPGDSQPVAALWGQNHRISSMMAKPDTLIVALESKEYLARQSWAQRSNLLLTTNLYLRTNKVVAAWLDRPTVGSRWTNCHVNRSRFGNQEGEWALCVFLNSTLGLLSVLGSCTESGRLNRPRVTVENLKSLMVPDFHALDPESMEALTRAFDALCGNRLRPFAELHLCQVRSAIDDAVCEALRVDCEEVRAIREALAAEPSMTGVRYSDEPFRQEEFALEGLSSEDYSRPIGGCLAVELEELGSRFDSTLHQATQQRLFS